MPKQIELVNQKFGDLTVKRFSSFDKNGNKLWVCECVCGNDVAVSSSKLISGKKKIVVVKVFLKKVL